MTMTKTATSPTTATFPAFKLPKLDLGVLFAMQRANLAAAREAHDVLLEAAQAIAEIQHGWVEQTFAAARAAMTGKEPRTAETVLAEIKGTTERTLAVVRQGVELGTAAQHRVGELFAQRATANVEQVKTLAA
jgi:hypothetical protein